MIRPTNDNMNIQLPVAPDYGLLAASHVEEVPTDWWISGFTYEVFDGSVTLNIIDAESNETQAISTDGPTSLQYIPFMIQARVEASTFGANLDDIKERGRAVLEISQGPLIEQAFWSAIISGDSDGNRNLTGFATSVGTGLRLNEGVFRLEKAYAPLATGLGGGFFEPTIHLNRGLAHAVKSAEQKDGVLRTNVGTKLAAGQRYGFSDSTTEDMFITGPTSVVLGDEVIINETPVSHAVSYRNNSVEYIVEKPVAVVWSTREVFSVSVDPTLPYN